MTAAVERPFDPVPPVALATYEGPTGPVVALVVDGRPAPLAEVLPEELVAGGVLGLLERWGEAEPLVLAAADSARRRPVTDDRFGGLRLLPPITPPGRLFAAAANYWGHVLQLGVAQRTDVTRHMTEDEAREHHRAGIQDRLEHNDPYLFLGLPSAVSGAEDDVVLPDDGEQHDWELELAVVIGARARNVPRERAHEVIAGYMVCNDITTRDRVQRPDMPAIGTDWLRGKSKATFFPTGPWFVPAAVVGDPMDLGIELRLNGTPMQQSSTSDMIFDVGRLVEQVSRMVEVVPGDVILTGSPAGNGVHWGRFLQPGDVLEGAIERLGVQRNACVAEVAALRST